jgi:hypothetical protein
MGAEIITKPGAYDVPISTYHSQCCDGPSISSSGLKIIRQKSPAHYWDQSDLNPNRRVQTDKKALNFGKAAHSLLLESKLPEDEFSLTPFSGPYNRNSDDWKAGEKQAWKAAQEEAGKAIVTADDLKVITEMADVLARHPLVKDGLLRGEIERSLFWRPEHCPMTGEPLDVWLKSRPDVIPHDDIYVDYKTVADASVGKFVRAVVDYGYHIQVAMAVDGLKATKGIEIKQAALLVQEKMPPYVVAVRYLEPSYIIAGRMEYCAGVRTFNECLKRNEWPGYEDADLNCPDWLEKRLEREEAA